MKIKKIIFFVPGIKAITLWPFGIFYYGSRLNIFQINHEKIHWEQQKEMLGLFFYLWYFIEWLIKIFTPPLGAYKDLSFEREAKVHQYDIEYLKDRKKYSWTKLILRK